MLRISPRVVQHWVQQSADATRHHCVDLPPYLMCIKMLIGLKILCVTRSGSSIDSQRVFHHHGQKSVRSLAVIHQADVSQNSRSRKSRTCLVLYSYDSMATNTGGTKLWSERHNSTTSARPRPVLLPSRPLPSNSARCRLISVIVASPCLQFS
jgi:hypothetical protein